MKKICIVFLGIMVLFFLGMDLVNTSYAYDGKEVTALVGGGTADPDVKNDIQKAGGVILDTIRIAGFGISIIMLVAFGIKYMTTMPAERAQMMKQSMVYLLGAVFIFGASFIVGIVVNVVEKATQF
jgi:hypothetical protein